MIKLADDSDPRLADALIKMYEESAARLKQIVLNPPGNKSAAVNQAMAAQRLAQVESEIARLKQKAASWTGSAMSASIEKGLKVGHEQAVEALGGAGIADHNRFNGSFSLIDHNAARILIKDTMQDLSKGADGMASVARSALTQMKATGVSAAQVNQILAGRAVIEGQPVQAIRELRTALEAVHGEKVVIPCKNGGTREFDTGYYAQLVARTKTRQAVVMAKHDQFAALGITLVKIVGRKSINSCSAFLNHVYSLSGHNSKYPALANLPSGGPPFHPQCSKSTAPFVEGLSKFTARGEEGRAAA